MLRFFVHGNVFKLNYACGLQVESKKMLSKEPKGKTKTMFLKWTYIQDCIWVYVDGLLKWMMNLGSRS
jgi:hypothetical protein